MKYKCTTKQAEIEAKFIANLKGDAEAAIERAKEAVGAVVPLPHTNESGEAVVHGANMVMLAIRDHYLNIADALTWFAERTLEDSLRAEINKLRKRSLP